MRSLLLPPPPLPPLPLHLAAPSVGCFNALAVLAAALDCTLHKSPLPDPACTVNT
jgi:hypothetical protein